MPCLRKEALARLLCNVTTTFKYFFLFSLFVAKLFASLFRTEDEYDGLLYEEDAEEEEEEKVEVEEQKHKNYEHNSHVERDHLVADIVNGGEGLVFLPKNFHQTIEQDLGRHTYSNSSESLFEDPVEDFDSELAFHVQGSPSSEFNHGANDGTEDLEEKEHDTLSQTSKSTGGGMRTCKLAIIIDLKEDILDPSHRINHVQDDEKKIDLVKEDPNFTKDDKFLIFAPPKSEVTKMQGLEKENDKTFGDTYTIGSTSKSSSEWRSSIRDSATEDPFSSSSRRSCPKWESYTVYQKYDEEMTYLDRISAQKLHETESLKSIQVEPRSISQRIVHKLANSKKQKSTDRLYQTKYHELEATYVAQVCLAWEALNWNYANFQRKQAASRTEQDPGCPAHIAQQFQQFQVLLQRYVENEPYERGRRPEIYARMRSVAPKLLQVPEYHDYEEEQKEEEASLRITSASFLTILEDAIRTFMNFLKADRESHCQVLAAMFRRRPRGTIDPTIIQGVKKHNKKMKAKLKDIQRPRNCLKRKKLPKEEEMKVLMGLIDLRLVSRVLRIGDITQEQLHWCEEKMSRIKALDGKLHRDSTPLFFPDIEAHPNPSLNNPYPNVPYKQSVGNQTSQPRTEAVFDNRL